MRLVCQPIRVPWVIPNNTGYNSHLSSKIIVDATRQWPEEGGPEKFAPMNKDCLLDSFPDALTVVENKWGHMITAQKKIQQLMGYNWVVRNKTIAYCLRQQR